MSNRENFFYSKNILIKIVNGKINILSFIKGIDIQECCICGKEVVEVFKAKIEDCVLDVCDKCSEYGERVEEAKTIKKMHVVAEPRPDLEEIILVENYGKKIEQARKRLMLTKKEFAEKIKEKESVITRIEKEKMRPSERLVEKIEKFLGISLRGKYEREPLQIRIKKAELTLGDVVDVE